jgi:hypothetical protein
MLKTLVVLLALANLAFFSWTQGWIDGPAGVRARGDREPERLNLQVQPEVVQLLPAQAAKAASAPLVAPPPAAPASIPAAPAPLACLEAGPFSGAEVAAAEAAVRAALPEGSWTSVKSSRPGLWMVYMGKFKDREEQVKKQEELRTMKVEYDDLRSPPELLPGLSLGRFEERANAVNALEKFSLRGIRTAKVIEVRMPASTVLLRVDRAGPALVAQATGLASTALGKGFTPCSRAVGN